MLETLRKQGASIVIYAVFGILIAVFVINFGAQSVGTHEGCTSSGNETVATIDGGDIGMPAWRWSGNFLSMYRRVPKQIRAQQSLEWLITREILADEAERRGLNVSDALVDDNLKTGRMFFAGQEIDGKAVYFEQTGKAPDEKYFFSYERLKALVSQLGLTVASFKEQQRRETLAAMMVQILSGEVRASKDEALTRFVFENSKVAYDVVSFSPEQYAAAITPTDADLDRWLEMHDADAKAQYEKDKKSYTATKPTVHLREIYVAKAEVPEAPVGSGSGSGNGSGSGSGTGTGATAAVAKDPGLDKITAAKADIASKKKTFVEVAKTLDADETQRARGGDLGWRTVEDPALGDPKLADAVRALKPGEVSPVITTDEGYYLLTVEDKREGDLPYEKVKRDIAATLAKKAWGDEAAKRAAIAALAEATAAKKNLGDMFPHGTSPEEKLRIQQELQQRMQQRLQQQNGESGAITVVTKDTPAAWMADDLAGSATAAGAGSGTGSATATATATATPAPAAEPIKATTEPLPSMAPVKPDVVRYQGMLRNGSVYGFEPSKELTAALFDELGDGMIAPRVYKLADGYVIVQLIKKDMAQMDAFEKKADEEIGNLARERGIRLTEGWLHDRCHALLKGQRIKYQAQLVAETDDQGHALPSTYRPCQSMDTEDDLDLPEPGAVPVPVQAPARTPTPTPTN